MPIKFQKFNPEFRRQTFKILLGQLVQQPRVSLIIEAIDARTADISGIEIVVYQLEVAGALLHQKLAIEIQSGVKTGLEHALGFGCGRAQLQNFERPEFGD
jgi:hypothetical protein